MSELPASVVACPAVAEPYPPELLHITGQLLRETLAMLPAWATQAADLLMARYPDHSAQAAEAARPLGASPRDVFLANVSYDIGCSTAALATPDGPVLARNLDWEPAGLLARAGRVIRVGDHTAAGFVGSVGLVTALSPRGVAVAINAAPGPSDPEGYPVLLLLRKVLDESADFAAAVAALRAARPMTGAMVTVVGKLNSERAVVELCPGRQAAVRMTSEKLPLVTTNGYRILTMAPYCPRWSGLTDRVNALQAGPSDADLLGALTDDRVTQDITAQHVVIRPAAGEVRLYAPARFWA
jgi:hypothetical protein